MYDQTTLPPAVRSANASRPQQLFYIDNIKIILTVLVILHHTFITYGASGGWYYTQKTILMGALVPMTMFVSLNQSFFMGFFFLLAAFFIPSSYQRKGAARFLADRFMRLAIPLVFYSLIFSPFVSYLVYYFGNGHHINYVHYLSMYDDWIEFGVLWFIAALLIFTVIYVLCNRFIKIRQSKLLPVPGAGMIVIFSIALGVISFIVRLIFPVGWILKPVGFQLGHFTQYIGLFIIGLAARKNNWFDQLSYQTGKRFALLALILLLFFPLFYIIRVRLNMPLTWYSGGFHWQALLYAVWEQCIGISILTALLAKGRQSWNSSSPVLAKLSRSAFAVYIFHPLVIVSLALAFRNWAVDPALKLLVAAPLAVIGSFLLGSLVVFIPLVKRIV